MGVRLPRLAIHKERARDLGQDGAQDIPALALALSCILHAGEAHSAYRDSELSTIRQERSRRTPEETVLVERLWRETLRVNLYEIFSGVRPATKIQDRQEKDPSLHPYLFRYDGSRKCAEGTRKGSIPIEHTGGREKIRSQEIGSHGRTIRDANGDASQNLSRLQEQLWG